MPWGTVFIVLMSWLTWYGKNIYHGGHYSLGRHSQPVKTRESEWAGECWHACIHCSLSLSTELLLVANLSSYHWDLSAPLNYSLELWGKPTSCFCQDIVSQQQKRKTGSESLEPELWTNLHLRNDELKLFFLAGILGHIYAKVADIKDNQHHSVSFLCLVWWMFYRA